MAHLTESAMKSICSSCLLVLFSFAALVVYAEEPRQIAWDDLSLKLSPAENPFAKLSAEQLQTLVDVAATRDRRARGVTLSPEEIANEEAAATKLEQAGIEIDRLLAQRNEVGKKQRAIAGAVNPAFDGQQIRLPGYLLPLEFTDKEVNEFLLVPWVGACIHTPPPPPNQIIHVKTDKPVAVSGAFDAVWVTGKLAISTSKRSVYITDGTSQVDVGYSMRASRVEPYKQ